VANEIEHAYTNPHRRGRRAAPPFASRWQKRCLLRAVDCHCLRTGPDREDTTSRKRPAQKPTYQRGRIIGRSLVVLLSAAGLVYGLSSGRSNGLSPDLRNGRVHIQDNLWRTAEHRYAVWVGADGTPYVGKSLVDGDRWTVVDLGRIPGNPLAAPTDANLHNVYTIAVDADERVHVFGNHRRSPLRYVRSARGGDISQWVSGLVPGPTERVTYPQLASLPDGTLLFFRREGMSGRGAVMLAALDPGAQEWRHVGNIIEGRPSDESPYLHRVAVDPLTGMVHLLFTWRRTGDVATTNDVEYARSPDAGRTWETSAGERLRVPLTHGASDVVIDTPPEGSGLLNQGGLDVDRCGRPHAVVTFDDGRNRSLEHVWHDGRSWQARELSGNLLEGRPVIVAGERVWLAGSKDAEVLAIDVSSGSAGAMVRLGRAVPNWEVTYDSRQASAGGLETLVPRDEQPLVLAERLPGATDGPREACRSG
jgi:hypothetical protein